MAWRFSNSVVAGEVDNTVKGRVTGWIQLSDRDERLQLKLTGDCHPDLAGWRFRIFRVDPPPPWDEPDNLDGLAMEQIGEAGDITEQTLRHFDCPMEEFLARKRAGEPVPEELRQTVYLEWYSDRNGRVVIQNTRLAIERIGKRAFELTAADLQRKADENQRKLDELREQGFVIEELGPGVTLMRQKSDDDSSDDDLQSHLDQLARDLERKMRDSLGAPPDDDA